MNGTSEHIGRVYAQALFELAAAADMVDAIRDDLNALSRVTAEEKEFVSFSVSPYFPVEHKSQLLHRVFEGKITELTMDFLEVVNNHNRIAYLPLVSQEYEKLRDEHYGCRLVKVTLAAPISPQEIKKLTDEIAAAFKGEAKLDVQVDPSIIGGIIIRRGDMVIDNTVKRELREAVSTITSRRKNQEKNYAV